MLAVTMSLESKPLTSTQVSKLQTLLQEKKWASIVLGLAELNLMAQGPIDGLIDAVNDIIDDLGRKLDKIDSDDDGISLAQVSSFKHQIEKVQKKLVNKNNLEGALVEALLAVSVEKFADSNDLDNVRNLLLKVKLNLEASLEKETGDEDDAQKAFDADIKAAKADIKESAAEVVEKQDGLAKTQEQIQDGNDFIEARTADNAQYQTDLKDENDSFDRATENFNNLSAQFQSELSACEEALGVVQNLTVEDYIQGRIDKKSGVIDQPHGQRFGLNSL